MSAFRPIVPDEQQKRSERLLAERFGKKRLVRALAAALCTVT